MNTKKLFIILLTFVISFCFCGCANNKNYANDNLSIIEASQEKFRFLVTVSIIMVIRLKEWSFDLATILI